MRQFPVLFILVISSFVFSRYSHADLLYGTVGGQALKQIDVSTGLSTLVGYFGNDFANVHSFDVDPTTGVFYGWSNSGDGQGLLTIDRSTGTGTLAGSNLLDLSEIAFNPDGDLYGFNRVGTSNFLYQLNLDGSVASTFGLSEEIIVFGADFDSNGLLHGLGSIGSSTVHFTANHKTGEILSTTSLALKAPGGLAFDSAGRMIGFGRVPVVFDDVVVEIDPVTGAITSSQVLTGNSFAQGAAFASSVPEPSMIGLASLASLFCVLRRRRRAS